VRPGAQDLLCFGSDEPPRSVRVELPAEHRGELVEHGLGALALGGERVTCSPNSAPSVSRLSRLAAFTGDCPFFAIFTGTPVFFTAFAKRDAGRACSPTFEPIVTCRSLTGTSVGGALLCGAPLCMFT
jgi:hypothetical protein